MTMGATGWMAMSALVLAGPAYVRLVAWWLTSPRHNYR